MSTGHTEKRRTPRCAIDLFVQEVNGARTFLHPAIDLSADGIYILAQDGRKAVDGDRAIRLEFALPTGLSVQTEGRIVHVDDRGGQLGLRIAFQDLPVAARDGIEAFVLETLGDAA